ncbi:YIP1 family protein [Rubrobacter indicoceani]|uniref:YIP1 family protein n=1 Tax=Rubrobacter indicoceani TaxID=2051957 RepID=UPI0013C4CE3B|nr:YIP1 family protein [Rubrobacter indicoceani]
MQEPAESISPEFDLSNPAGSYWLLFRSVVSSPRRFFLGFRTEGDLREPAVYAVVTGVLAALVAVVARYGLSPVFGVLFGPGTTGDEVYGLGALEALGFAVVYPAFVALAAAVYLLAIRVFVGKVGDFGALFRMTSYGFGAMILAWLPFVGAFAITYSLLVVMVIGIRYVFSTTLVTALVVALTGFVPLSLGLIALRGLAFQVFGS